MIRCRFCQQEATFRFYGRFPKIREFATCDDHYPLGERRIRGCAVRSTALLRVICQEDLERALEQG